MTGRRTALRLCRGATARCVTTLALLAAIGAVAAPGDAGATTPSIPPPLSAPRWSFASVADENELANELAEATGELDVCFGWTVTVGGSGAARSMSSTGSNFGPEQPMTRAACPNGSIELIVELIYTSESSEESDSGRWYVEVSPPLASQSGLAPTTLKNLVSQSTGMSTENLMGDNDDVALARMVLALPLLYREHLGRTTSVEVESATPETAEIDGTVDASPGSDSMRQTWPVIAVFAIGGAALGLALGWGGARLTLADSTMKGVR
jgi:hypothetical protein